MSDDEDDWFERARRELEEGEESASDSEAESDSEVDTETEAESDSEVDTETEAESTESGPESDSSESQPDSTSQRESDEHAGDGPDSRPRSADREARSDPDPGGDEDRTGEFGFGTFDEESSADAAGGEAGDAAGDDAFERGDSDATGFGGADAPTPEFDESTGFDPGGGGDDFGFGSFGGGEEGGGFAAPGGGADFDEEAFESDLDRIDVGIEGLDEMILGGVPTRSLMVTIGSAGTGKTTFSLQFLEEALSRGERAVYITLEESREAILSTAEEKGWGFREYESEGLLAVVSIDPIEMANSLDSIGNELATLIREFGAERLVLDSVSLLEMMYDHPAKRRSEIFEFTRSLKQAGVTTMLTSEASESNPYASRHGIVEYLTDAVFVLQYVRPSDFRETRLAIEIQKIRNANHARETKPYEITDEGISVYRRANIF